MTPQTRARLEAAAESTAYAITERNAAIRDAHTEGASLREIAAVIGLSWSGVRKIINQTKGATP